MKSVKNNGIVSRTSFHLKKAARRPAWKKQPGNAQRNPVLAEHRNTMEGFTRAVWAMAKRIQPVSGLDKNWSMGRYPHSPD